PVGAVIHYIRLLFLAGLLSQVCYKGPAWAQELEVEDELRAYLRASIASADSFEDRFEAEVWLTTKSGALERYVKDPSQRLLILRLVHREAKRVNLPADMILAVIHVESLFDPYAVSH